MFSLSSLRIVAKLSLLIAFLITLFNIGNWLFFNIAPLKRDTFFDENGSVAGYHYPIQNNLLVLQELLEKPVKNIDVEAVNNTIFEGIVHHDQREIQFQEDWLLWGLSIFYPPFSKIQDPVKIITGEGAMCNEVSTVLKHILEINDIPSRYLNLNGHTLIELQTKSGWRVADPDFGIIFPADLKTLVSDKGAPIMQKMLKEKGYSNSLVKNYINILQTTEDNTIYDVSQMAESPRRYFVEKTTKWLKWIMPLLIGLIGGLIIKRSNRFSIINQPLNLNTI